MRNECDYLNGSVYLHAKVPHLKIVVGESSLKKLIGERVEIRMSWVGKFLKLISGGARLLGTQE